jgi:hypothetical protein
MNSIEFWVFGATAVLYACLMVVGLTPALYRRTSVSWIRKVGTPIDSDVRDWCSGREDAGRCGRWEEP